MAWPTNVSSGDVIQASGINAIISALSLWGGAVNGNGNALTNVASAAITGAVTVGTSLGVGTSLTVGTTVAVATNALVVAATGHVLIGSVSDRGAAEPLQVTGAAWVSGRTTVGGPNSAPTDGNLAASQISFWVDESTNNLKVRVKYANGTTLKTATVALV